VLILVLYAASGALGLFTRYISLRVNKRAVARLRIMLTRRLYALSRAELDRSSVGQLQSVVVQDSERVDVMSNAIVALLLPAAVVSLGLMVVALVLSPLLCVALVAVIPIMLAADRLLANLIRRQTRRWQRAFDSFSSATALALRAMSLTKVHGAEPIEIERRSRLAEELSAAGQHMAWTGGAYTILQQSVSACAGVAVLIVGGWSIARGDMTVGELLGFYAIAALLLRQVSLIVANVPVVLSGYESVARLNRLLQTGGEEPYGGTQAVDFDGAVAFEQVSFAYDGRPALHDLSFFIDSGEHVAIVGPNGAGKSTVVSLLVGLYRPAAGRVLANGVPFDELDMPRFRRSIGVVLQDPIIFPGTLSENIAYGRPGATEEEIRLAAACATAAEFAEALPQGYETPVGDEGVLLSAGQRQRLAIARALLGRPRLLILDEPTTHLDDDAVAQLMENLRELPGSPTVVAISHDPEIEAWAGRVIHLRDGKLAADMAAVAQRA
ncbi:MAG: ABC transporter ATP-binding protein, partial [Solirubrobacterales bacterium]|nr:ABC transporter ATP-binding protein [Solirubrobacterales bacterium]